MIKCFECDSELVIDNPNPWATYVCDDCIERYLHADF